MDGNREVIVDKTAWHIEQSSQQENEIILFRLPI